MLHRLTYFFILATAPVAGCGSNPHCIGDCEPQTTSSDTAGPVTSTEGDTSTTANGETTTGTTTADAPTTSISSTTSTTAEDITTTGAEGQMTCRDGIQCMVNCLLMVPKPTPPEYDVNECLFTDCLDLLSDAEMLKLQNLQECAENSCEAMFDCAEDEDQCEACVWTTIGSTKPPPAGECEALSKACQ